MILRLVKKEIFYRKLNFTLSVLAVFLAVTLFVSFYTTSEASKRETVRLTRDMGFNLRIIPEKTDMDQFWQYGFSSATMPEENLKRFMAHGDFSFAHLSATLHHKIRWQEMDIVLTGISDEIEPSGIQKSPMIHIIEPGTLVLGFEIARRLDLNEGDSVTLLGKEFILAKTLTESGNIDDIRVFARLEEIQDMLNMKGRINEIRALNCLCLTSEDQDPLLILRDQLKQVLPEAKIIMDKNIAIIREKQRLMFEKYFAFVIPFLVVACAVWIAMMVLINVKDRKYEIGVLRALGYGGGDIAALFLGKAIFIGLVGAVLGYIAGTAFSLIYGPDIFKVTAAAIKPMYQLLTWSLAAAIGFSVVSALLPTMIAITRDPAQILRGD
jgi:ABC-type lipoprotein release transport system permease subunit